MALFRIDLVSGTGKCEFPYQQRYWEEESAANEIVANIKRVLNQLRYDYVYACQENLHPIIE